MVPAKTTTAHPVVISSPISTPPTTSGPLPLKCPKPKTKIPIYYVVFTGPNQLGDYNYMIKQPEYKNTLFIFNDNKKQHYSWDKGSGNAVIRPYNYYGWWKIIGLTKPLSAGISTGDGMSSDKGYQQLDTDTLHEINLRVDNIRSTLLTKFTYDQIIYSGTNKQNPKFKSDSEDLLGISKYEVSKKVREYITQQIKCLGDFRGKLKQTTPLKDIQNAAPVSKKNKNVTFSPISETRLIINNKNNNNIIEHGYVNAAKRLTTYNGMPFTSNPKRRIAMGTGAGLAVLAGLAFAGGGRKETHTRKKKKKKRAGTRKHLRKTQESSGFSLNKRQKVKKCYKTQKRRR